MMKKTLAKILAIIILTTFLMQNIIVYGVTEKEKLENEKAVIDDQIEEQKQKQEKLEAQKSETLKSVENLMAKISSSETEIEQLENKINELKKQIEEKKKDIQQKENEYNEQEKLLDARVTALYESGETSYLDVLLTSSSITDFLSRYYYASELVDYDKKLIQEIKEQKEEIEKQKEELEAAKKELDTALAQSEQKNTELKSLKKEKEKEVKKLTEQEKEVQAEIEELEAANKKILADIKQAEIRYQKQLEELRKQEEQKKKKNQTENSSNNNNSNTTITSSGYLMRPVASNNITAKAYYSSGKFHGAIDYGVPVGTTVMAAADGVVMSTANLSGSYGTYVVIRHANGLETYYAHGKYGSISVKAGDTVKKGQKIMLSGNTGNSEGPHLHFEVRKSPYKYSYSAKAYGDDSRVNPLNYM